MRTVTIRFAYAPMSWEAPGLFSALRKVSRMVKMTAATYAKIQAAADSYLKLSSESPERLDEFLDNLRQHLGWADEEIVQLHMTIVDLLLPGRAVSPWKDWAILPSLFLPTI